jgi:putative ABC transport system permease protein
MNIMSMAVRNLGRNRRRTFLAALSVFIAILLVIFLDGFATGLLDSMTRNLTKNVTGNVNVTTSAWRAQERFMPASASIADGTAVANAIRGTPGLAGSISLVAQRARFGVILSSASATKAAVGLAGDPATERQLLMLDRSLLPGSSYIDRPGTAIVGKRLAATLGLKVGDTLKVVTEKADRGLGFKKFRISGLFRTGVEAFDGATFQVGLEDARDLLGLGSGASQVLVMLKDYRESDRAARLIDAALTAHGFTGLSVKSWTSQGDTAQMISMLGSIYFWIWIVVAFLGAFIIANVMMMVILERKHEIGILKSMGMSRLRILGLFLAEGTMLGVIGAAAGVILGTALNAWLGVHGMDMSKNLGALSMPLDTVIRPVVNAGRAIAIFVLGVGASAVVALLPARSAARMDPIDTIRSV